MKKYTVTMSIEDPQQWETVNANYFVEEKGWVVFYKNNARVAAFNGNYVQSVLEDVEPCELCGA